MPTLKDHGGRLESVEVLFFDILGTMLDWHGTVARALKRQGDRLLPEGCSHSLTVSATCPSKNFGLQKLWIGGYLQGSGETDI